MASNNSFVEFKIYISLKQMSSKRSSSNVLQNSKFTYLSNVFCCFIFFFKFCRIQNLHISQTYSFVYLKNLVFCRIQNLHISQTTPTVYTRTVGFCRIQNLHISQTVAELGKLEEGFVEFKIYISLKHNFSFLVPPYVLQNSKFTYLSNQLARGKNIDRVLQNSKFTYLSNRGLFLANNIAVLQNSKFTYLSN